MRLELRRDPLPVFWRYRVKSPRGGAPLMTHGEAPGKVEVPGRLVTGDPLDLARREPGDTAKGKEPGSRGLGCAATLWRCFGVTA